MPDFTTSSRGFKGYEPIITDYGHIVRIYESSAAKGPCIWMAVDADDSANGDDGELHVHMTLSQAERLRDSLDACILNHYQN